jgi:DNA invertase Pin-like site-specific DNA recombinase
LRRDTSAIEAGVYRMKYVDNGIAGIKDSQSQLDRLMKDARARKLYVIIVARFDRFARSTRALVKKVVF